MAQKLRPKYTLLEVDSGSLLYAPKFPSYDSERKVAIDLINVTVAPNIEGDLVPLKYPLYKDTEHDVLAGYVDTQFVPAKRK